MAEPDQETDWIRRSQKGDHEAFGKLIQLHQRMIHSLAYRMTGSLSDAEDLAQEVFIRAFHQIRSFRSDARFASWLHRIAVNQCLNWRKSHDRRERFHEELGAVTEAPRDHEGASERVQQALLQLKPKQRAAVVLTLCEGMNHADAARALGCSETTVSWRLFIAKRELKRLLQAPA